MKPTGAVADPIGREVSSAGRAVARAFGAALSEAGGSLPMWLIIQALKQERRRTQHDLATALEIRSPTLTRHLDNLEVAGLIVRTRGTDDRRVVRITLTSQGQELFTTLRQAAAAFETRLRLGFSEEELYQLRGLLRRLRANIDA